MSSAACFRDISLRKCFDAWVGRAVAKIEEDTRKEMSLKQAAEDIQRKRRTMGQRSMLRRSMKRGATGALADALNAAPAGSPLEMQGPVRKPKVQIQLPRAMVGKFDRRKKLSPEELRQKAMLDANTKAMQEPTKSVVKLRQRMKLKTMVRSEMATHILNSDGDTIQKAVESRSAWYQLVRCASEGLLEELVALTNDIDGVALDTPVQDTNGRSLLHFAAENGKAAMVRHLVHK